MIKYIYTLLFAFFVAYANPAYALDVHELHFDLPIRGPAPIFMNDTTVETSQTQNIMLGVWDVNGFTEPEGTVTCTWGRVKIKSDDYSYVAEFYGHISDWPTQSEWNSNTAPTCTYVSGAGFNVVVTLHIKDRYDTWRSGGASFQPSGWTPATGIAVVLDDITLSQNGTSVVAKQTDVTIVRKLPAGTYTTGWTQCKRTNGANWQGVWLYVSNTTDIGQVAIFDNAPEDNGGKCVLLKTGGNVDMPVTLDRAY